MKVNILGTKYDIKLVKEDPNLKDGDGYCDTSVKECVIDDMSSHENCVGSKKDLTDYRKQVIRHELIHAFLYESGLEGNSWAMNEEMVNWLAIQFPKIEKAFREVDCI